jgi:DNA polymerase-3 subunit delta'
MALADIVGQERALDILRGFQLRERVPHALLFAGDEGIGKKLVALNFAKALNCRAAGVGDQGSGFEGWNGNTGEQTEGLTHDSEFRTDACEQCPSCKKINSGNHPDVSVVGPEGDGGQITVSAVRALEETLSFKPFEGRWKVAVIDDADRLNQSAANAFLRTLEEPTPQSVLILVSSRPEVLLPTIRSRCQKIYFSPLPVDAMSDYIRENMRGLSDEQSALLSLLSGGRIGTALNENLIEQRDHSYGILRQLLGTGAEDVWEDKDDMERWFDWVQLWMRDIAVFRATGKTGLLVNADRTGEIRALAGSVPVQDILKLARELYTIRRRLFFNLNKQVTLNYTSLLLRKRLGKLGD